MKLLLLVVFCICVTESLRKKEGQFVGGDSISNEIVLVRKKLYVSYELDFKRKIVNFVVEARTKGWFGFGWSPDGEMVHADMIIAWMTLNHEREEVAMYGDFWAPQRTLPLLDTSLGGTDDFHVHSLVKINDQMYLNFSRAFQTADKYDQDIYLDRDMHFVWALGADKDVPLSPELLRMHRMEGSKRVNLIAGKSTKPMSSGGPILTILSIIFPVIIVLFLLHMYRQFKIARQSQKRF
eukprot:TRINITY_DN5281_c0_g1_i1.p1 TRINITY_DN5281_c0_g1~~TRINITY_DN5281_c0_g1_i1.p1  ORF type:complete len:238 (-),score=26.08 TRINITY_DN5281_c0_g1_i1:87-800(-)